MQLNTDRLFDSNFHRVDCNNLCRRSVEPGCMLLAMDPDRFDPMDFLLHRPAPRQPPSAPKVEPRPELTDEEASAWLAHKHMPWLFYGQ
jgi:hypothetical protein